MIRRMGLYSFVYFWLLVLLVLPAVGIVVGAFQGGADQVWMALTSPEGRFALRLTLEITVLTVVINTVFGVLAALHIARRHMRGWRILNAVVDLPFAVSPVIAGLALVLVYGPNTFIGGWLQAQGAQVMFAFPGMVLATLFVTFPFVVRELVPVLRAAGVTEEEAAFTLGASAWRTFWQVTFPNIRWSLWYGITLTIARALGEFGAVLVVSGSVIMKTQTATLYIYQATEDGQMQVAYAMSLLLAAISFVILLILQYLKKRQRRFTA
ncbi:sulfate ABC transporter permease subunit CysW [Alicyclobacillus contaminans]|uniref:sulfate ABC transporter permease n=1 Tax=Alicyclobacillus contaminans TaxID=392016 RepID=UPI00040AC4EE|nr:sulfate ABC transporter permease subunit [Alicyclobacillus contaminans]GMA49859.1 sulfate ABC transporter permease subunit CysW [Alicyclobacillus contaminans]